jgi:acyl-CoA synthetase (AMP-forming)/AMP-acid ligase II
VLGSVVAEAARRFGDRPALTTPQGWSLTFAQLDRLADETAAGLARRGLGVGDVVALVVPSGCAYAIAYVASARLGAICVGVNPVLAPTERVTACDAVGPRFILAADELAAGLPSDRTETIAAADTPERVLAGIRRDPSGFTAAPEDPDRDVAIVLTSGTTGRPKGAVFRGRQLQAVTRYDLGPRAAAWGGGGPMLAGTQFAHVGFMTKFAWYVRTGAELMLLDRWRAADVLDIVEATRMPVIGGVAPQVALMLRDDRFDERDFSAVQALIMGGAPSPPALVVEARRRFDAA